MAFLDHEKFENVLIFGGGTGKLLVELMKRDFSKQYYYVDISDKMIARAKKKVQKKFPEKINSIKFISGSYSQIPAEKFDAIFTPYVLDCFTEDELPVVMNELDKHLSQNGEWYFSDFNIPETKMKGISSFVIRSLYFMFNIICGLGIKKLPDFHREFNRLCYNTADEKYFVKGMIVSRIYRRRKP
jgi:ubiquinone/menaquinone biosynthesis C-methylase UbiE